MTQNRDSSLNDILTAHRVLCCVGSFIMWFIKPAALRLGKVQPWKFFERAWQLSLDKRRKGREDHAEWDDAETTHSMEVLHKHNTDVDFLDAC